MYATINCFELPCGKMLRFHFDDPLSQQARLTTIEQERVSRSKELEQW